MSRRYLAEGAQLRCTLGTSPGALALVPRPVALRVGGSPLATVQDTVPMANLPSFGIEPNYSSRGNDTIFGLHAGVQRQWGNWVLGAEAAYSAGFRDMRSETRLPDTIFGPTYNAVSRIDNLVTVGPRLGYAWDRVMIYGTGGYAAASLTGQYRFVPTGLLVFPPGTNLTGTSWNNGWFAGAGVEYMAYKGVLADLILGAEYQHFDLRSTRAFTDTIFFNAPVTYDHSAVGDIVRVRLTVKGHGWGIF